MFEAAKKEAEKSDYKRFHVGAVLVFKKHIIGKGHNSNKTNPLQKEYNKYRNFNNVNGNYFQDSVHAEISSICDVSYPVGIEVDWSKVSIYVYRISAGRKDGHGLAKPCPACLNALMDIGVRKIYYTDNEGYAYLELDK